MSISVQLGFSGDPPNKLNKSFTVNANLDCVFKDETDVVNPIILVEMDYASMVACNYAYIPTNRRYYYITDVTSVSNALCTLSLEVDVLMSFKSEIRNLAGITERNTNLYNVYLNDDRQKITCQFKQFYHTFKGGDISHFKPHASILATLVGSE